PIHLHEGMYSVQDFLDLHGCTLAEAELIISGFIKESIRKGYRCIKVIHGRGLRSPNGPVLKSALVKWLSGQMRKYIMAFATAPQYDGGLGALYILLKKV
ncbi:smr domain-containing protein, partial [Candidatus Magnetobacterium bavaricum]